MAIYFSLELTNASRAFFDRCGYFKTDSSPIIAAGDEAAACPQFAHVDAPRSMPYRCPYSSITK
jgi:hypothetical protein